LLFRHVTIGHVNAVTSFVTPMWKAWRETLRRTPCVALNQHLVGSLPIAPKTIDAARGA